MFVVALGDEAKKVAFPLIMKLRDAGIAAQMDYGGRSMKSQMKQANKSGARHAVIIGEDEVKENAVMLRDMSSSEQEKVSLADVISKLKN